MNKKIRGMVLGCLGCICWGFSGVCINYLTNNYEVGDSWVGCVRLLCAGIVFLAITLTRERASLVALLHDRRALVLTVAYAILGMSLMQVVYVIAIRSAGAASDSLIAQTSLVYVMLFTCIRKKCAPKKIELFCIVLAFAGVFCIATKGDVTKLAIGFLPLMFCLADGVLMFLHNTIPLEPLRKYGTMPVNSVALVLGGIFLLPVAQPWAKPLTFGLDGWLALGATIFVGAGLGYMLTSQGLKDAGALLGTFACVLEPVSAMVFSVLILGVTFVFADVLGCLFIAAMMVLLTIGERSPDETSKAILEP